MRYTYQPRLEIYHNILGKFDLIDKYNNSQSKFFKSISIKISWHFNEWNKSNFNKLLFKEFYLQQRFKYQKTSKRIENTFFIITLRNIYMFLYLEMLLNSYFLETNSRFRISVYFTHTVFTLLTISRQNKFFNNPKNKFTNFKLKNLFRFNSTKSSKQILSNFNYYYIPTYTINLGE